MDDIERLCALAGMKDALDASASTILKDNISWHPFPGANTTPWQLQGTTRALRRQGFRDVVCVQNKTVVTNAFKGEDLNKYVPIFEHENIPVLYNFRDADMTWIDYRPKARMHVLHDIFPEGISIPDYFVGKNIVHLPTTAGRASIARSSRRGSGTRPGDVSSWTTSAGSTPAEPPETDARRRTPDGRGRRQQRLEVDPPPQLGAEVVAAGLIAAPCGRLT
jgi:hypothetical protein